MEMEIIWNKTTFDDYKEHVEYDEGWNKPKLLSNDYVAKTNLLYNTQLIHVI